MMSCVPVAFPRSGYRRVEEIAQLATATRFYQRFIRGSVITASYVLVFLGSAQSQSIIMGETSVLRSASVPGSGNGNLPTAQSATLAQAATIQSLYLLRHRREQKSDLGIYVDLQTVDALIGPVMILLARARDFEKI
jgi:hypothetical protein